MNKNSIRKDILFGILLIILILCVAIFNYTIDPYYIFRDATIKGFNNVKTHKYSNKRTIIYSDIKLNHKNKDTVFTGNCLLSHYGSGLNNVAFFTIPVAKVEEVSNIIKNMINIAPNIKKIYWGLFFDDFWNIQNDEVNDSLLELKTKKIYYQDFINLFFSYNTTKYSIETIIDSIKNKGEDIIYIYPYREIAKKNYNNDFPFEQLEKIIEIKNLVKEKNIELVIYYSPIHLSKKIHIYGKKMWETNQKLKFKLAQITDFYDYSLFNEYNTDILDEKNKNFIDNIHPTNTYNNKIVNDLLSENKIIGTLITKENVERILEDETIKLKNYMDNNKKLTDKIQNVTINDVNIKLKKI